LTLNFDDRPAAGPQPVRAPVERGRAGHVYRFGSGRRARVVLTAVFLFLLNAWVCHELFGATYLNRMSSIEGGHIAIVRWAAEHPWDFRWFPLWYGGVPYQNTYPPLMHLTAAAFARVSGASPAGAYHTVTAVIYCLGPVTLFLLAYYFTRRLSLSALSAGFYSLLSPSAALMPSVLADLESVFGPRRLQALVVYGEGPHITSLTLLPLVVIAIDWALRKTNPLRFLVAASVLAAAVLTNWIGAVAMAAAAAALLLAWTGPGWTSVIARSAAIALFAYALAFLWIPPSTVADVRRNAQSVLEEHSANLADLGYAIVVALLLGRLYWAFRRTESGPLARFSVYFLCLTGSLALGAEWLSLSPLPQPDRYHLEMEMALPPLAVFGVAALVSRFSSGWPRRALGLACCVFLAVQVFSYRAYARNWLRPIDITERIEYRAAKWLEAHRPESRVAAAGSVRFWLNAFTDNPQLGGQIDQAISNPVIPHITHGLLSAEATGEQMLQWFRAFGVDAVVVNGPQSEEVYHDFDAPEKFEGVLPVAWRGEHDVIYEAPRRSHSLAHVIPPEARVRRAPSDARDTAVVEAFVKALEDPSLPPAHFIWRGSSDAVIIAELEPHQLLAVQVSYDPGWRAWVRGKPRRITRDALGQMLIEPRCAGRCRVELSYRGGPSGIARRLRERLEGTAARLHSSLLSPE